MKKLLLTLFTISNIYANSTNYSVIIDKPFNDALFDITQDYNREISAIGYSNSFQVEKKYSSSDNYNNVFSYLDSLSSKNGSQIHLIKLDRNKATITLSKTIKLSNFNKANSIVKTPNNGYFIGGYTLEGSLVLLKLDTNGNILFNKKFGTSNYDKMNSMILLADGGVLTIGSAVTTRSKLDNVFESGLGKNDIYLTRFSKNGRKLWSKKYGTADDDKGLDAVEADDGSIIVVSTTSYNDTKTLVLMRIDENGDKIWLTKYPSKEKATPYKIIKLRDNNFVLSLSFKNDMQKEQIKLIKFDLHKNILIDKTINTTYSSILKDIGEFSDSTLIAVGSVRDAFNTDALVMIIDSDLNMLKQEHYGDENYDIFNALTILDNSQVAVAGIHTSKSSQESNMWLVKLNRDGNMSQIIK